MTRTALLLLRDLLHFAGSTCASRTTLAAENLFLRKQLAFYVERNVRPRRLDDAARIALVLLARVIDWRHLLTVVRPDTLVRWHRQGFRLFWRWKSRCPGRPRIPSDLQDVIATMARANQTWGEERIAAELLLKLGVSVSPPVHASAGAVSAAFIIADVAHVWDPTMWRDHLRALSIAAAR